MDPFDLASLFSLRELQDGLTHSAVPKLATVTPVKQCRSIAILPGSFNPPTAAHVLLAERALTEGYECVMFTYARATVGKKPGGLTPEDRLLTVRAATGDRYAVAAVSHGLYADQAEAATAMFPGAEIGFLVGSDKVLQIFQDRWYGDRTTSLERFFSLARLVVAPRSDHGERLKWTLQSPANRMWARRVEVLRLHPAVSDLSSTRVRGLLRAGADPAGLVPAPVAEILSAVRAFAPPLIVGNEEVDAYDVRARLIDLLWSMRGRDAVGVDLRALVRTATSPSDAGRALRATLMQGMARAGDLERAQAASGG